MGEKIMKEKRILAMFITSIVTLVASLSVTFGVLTTLADPVVATGVVRYAFAFNGANDSKIYVDQNTMKIKEDIVFQPASSLVWSEEEGKQSVWFNGTSYEDEIVYADEAISTMIKVLPVRISNKFDSTMIANIKISYDDSTLLGRYTVVKIYNYKTQTFSDFTNINVELAPNQSVDYAIIVSADDSMNSGKLSVNYGTDWENINVEITKVNA